MKANEPYYPTGMYGQQETKGRTVFEELTVKNVVGLLGNCVWHLLEKEHIAAIVATAREIARQTISQLNDEEGQV